MNLANTIEALLYFKNEPMSVAELAKTLGKSSDEIRSALSELGEQLRARGIVLVTANDEVRLGTAPAASELIEKLTKDELSRELSKAALETLSVVLYCAPVGRSEVDYIRGVNSQFILRNLLVRGLVDKVQSDKDQRAVLYRPTLELLSLMGLTSIESLPDYASVRAQLEAIKQGANEAVSNA